MSTVFVRIVILAPFAILLVAAFAFALLIEWLGDFAGGDSAAGRAP
jgi:hypothetical protein